MAQVADLLSGIWQTWMMMMMIMITCMNSVDPASFVEGTIIFSLSLTLSPKSLGHKCVFVCLESQFYSIGV